MSSWPTTCRNPVTRAPIIVLGLGLAHTHDGYADHDHDFPDELPLEENPIWIADHVRLTMVGVDIGSSGTQVIFSRINLRRLGEDLSSRYVVTSRETLFQSVIALTPYRSEEHIDEAALGAIIDDAYKAASIDPAGIDTGAVILTGEALRRENAQAVAAIAVEKGGDFVCVTAGHHMESMLAAYGSAPPPCQNSEGARIRRSRASPQRQLQRTFPHDRKRSKFISAHGKRRCFDKAFQAKSLCKASNQENRSHGACRAARVAPPACIPGFCLACGTVLPVGNGFSSLSIV